MLRLLPSSEGDVGDETSQNTGTSHCTPGAVQNTRVGLVQAALLDHLILNTNIGKLKPGQTTCQTPDLILDQELHSLDGGGRGLGDSRSNAGEQKVLSESQFLVRHVE